jgi:perosamine synthetase
VSRDYSRVTEFIRELYGREAEVPLHAPRFVGREEELVADCIRSTFVSYVGEYVGLLENSVSQFVGSRFGVAIVNGTEALHVALMLAGVERGDEVVTQSLSFVATSNAIAYCGAAIVYIDVDLDTLGLSPTSLEDFLSTETTTKADGFTYNRRSGRRIKACVPVHTLGFPCKIDAILEICGRRNIVVIEDAAESLGSRYKHRHTGTFGQMGVLSFNGNKIVTTGGGGMILTDDEQLAGRGRYISSTAKRPHRWEFYHDEIGYNLRMPNVNAAIGVAQMESLPFFVERKRETARLYKEFFATTDFAFVSEPENSESNYWLNSVRVESAQERDELLRHCNDGGIAARPLWRLSHTLPMYKDCQTAELTNAEAIQATVVNLPSSVRTNLEVSTQEQDR